MLDSEVQVQSEEDYMNSLLDKVSELTHTLDRVNEHCRELERENNGLIMCIRRYENLIVRVIYDGYKNEY